jgi:hypothetical protein
MSPSTRFGTLLAVAAVATLALVLLGARLAQAQDEEGWTRIDCAGATLRPPPGLTANCFQGPFAKVQGPYDCRLSDDSFGFLPDRTDPHFYVRMRYPKVTAKACSAMAFPDPGVAMQHVHKFVEHQAKNWSELQAIGSDLSVMFFDVKSGTRDGKCFAFVKLGPSSGYSGKGYRFNMRGFFCAPPGQPLDAAKAAAMVSAVQVKLE